MLTYHWQDPIQPCLSVILVNPLCSEFFWGNIKNMFMFSMISWLLSWHRMLKSVLMEDNGMFIQCNQCHGCWWCGSARSQGISSHGINSLWPSDAMWQHRSGSTLVQVLACCLKAPSHGLNQNWHISKVQWGQFHMRQLSHQSLKLAWKILI